VAIIRGPLILSLGDLPRHYYPAAMRERVGSSAHINGLLIGFRTLMALSTRRMGFSYNCARHRSIRANAKMAAVVLAALVNDDYLPCTK
jgi:hypothetical protein